MSLKVEYSAFSLSCLNDIYEYILNKSKSNQQASHQIELLLNSIEILKEQPQYGKKEELLEYLNRNIRFIIKGEYKIIYEYT
jgi:plasmid stabilization system protein ParE